MTELYRWPFTPPGSEELELVIYQDGSESVAYVFDRGAYLKSRGYSSDAFLDYVLNLRSLLPYMRRIEITFDVYYAVREAAKEGSKPSEKDIAYIDLNVTEAYLKQLPEVQCVPD